MVEFLEQSPIVDAERNAREVMQVGLHTHAYHVVKLSIALEVGVAVQRPPQDVPHRMVALSRLLYARRGVGTANA